MNGALADWEKVYQLMSLTEAPVEGIHCLIAHETQRAHGIKIPAVFAKLRGPSTFDRLRRWFWTPDGPHIVAYEWARYKRVVKAPIHRDQARAIKCRHLQFAKHFYRLPWGSHQQHSWNDE